MRERRSVAGRPALVLAVLALVLARPAAGIAATRRYDTHYLFSATRALAADNMADGWKAVLAPATVVVDLASLPFALLLGLGGLVPDSGDAGEG